MKKLLVFVLALAFAVPAHADHHEEAKSAPEAEPKPKVEVVSVGEDGKPDVVRIDGYETKVCKGDVKDACINPQDAGFDWGGTEINYWPGKPASEIDEPLPVDKPPVDRPQVDKPEGE